MNAGKFKEANKKLNRRQTIASGFRDCISANALCLFCSSHGLFIFIPGLRSHGISHQSGELPGLGVHGIRRGFQCRVDPQGESFLPLHPTHPQPMERPQEGPDQQRWTGVRASGRQPVAVAVGEELWQSSLIRGLGTSISTPLFTTLTEITWKVFFLALPQLNQITCIWLFVLSAFHLKWYKDYKLRQVSRTMEERLMHLNV